MSQNEKTAPLRILCLITTPKLADKAAALFQKEAVPIQYQWNAVGTAPNEMIDILGLGSPDKQVLLSILPKGFADEMLKDLKKKLRMGTVNSGIAFTLPLTGANNLIVQMMEHFRSSENETPERKEEMTMAERKHALVAAIVEQGFSEEVMEVARQAGAGGGTVVHSRCTGNKEEMGFWGMSIQEEKEMLLIVTDVDSKRNIMQAISDKFGMHSEAKGTVLSLPIDAVIGLNDQ